MAAKPAPTGKRAERNEDRFVAEYLASGDNGVVAYMRTFPKATYDGARANAAKMLARTSVRTKLRQARQRLRDKTGVRAELLVAQLLNIAMSSQRDVFDFSGTEWKIRPANAISIAAADAIAHIEIKTVPPRRGKGKPITTVKVRMHDKIKAIEKLGSMIGLWDDRPEIDKALEKLLAQFPPQMAAALRSELARAIGDFGGGNRPRDARPEPANPEANSTPPHLDGGGGFSEIGDDPGPVAGALPQRSAQTPTGPGVPPGGEDLGNSGEDLGPLFDD